jgi:hypothetical protein
VKLSDGKLSLTMEKVDFSIVRPGESLIEGAAAIPSGNVAE